MSGGSDEGMEGWEVDERKEGWKGRDWEVYGWRVDLMDGWADAWMDGWFLGWREREGKMIDWLEEGMEV